MFLFKLKINNTYIIIYLGYEMYNPYKNIFLLIIAKQNNFFFIIKNVYFFIHQIILLSNSINILYKRLRHFDFIIFKNVNKKLHLLFNKRISMNVY